ncbi:MAG: hypothetical protein GOMPHAMPRED_006221 [Gomphillus americanus]|uniref:Uncharacterized protein n=1 Tax=Gomphillus americanus TaxID=1940652 RepID=A0A8H3ELC1_9LECA|nr:MAG: hypothetical protein GOMPHAMPRED_006221 [Gomphillus americanus]
MSQKFKAHYSGAVNCLLPDPPQAPAPHVPLGIVSGNSGASGITPPPNTPAVSPTRRGS